MVNRKWLTVMKREQYNIRKAPMDDWKHISDEKLKKWNESWKQISDKKKMPKGIIARFFQYISDKDNYE